MVSFPLIFLFPYTIVLLLFDSTALAYVDFASGAASTLHKTSKLEFISRLKYHLVT